VRDLSGLLGLLAGLAALAGILRELQKRFTLAPELVRKLFHMGGGTICLALPWLLPDTRFFLGATVMITALLASLQRVPALRAGLGKVLGEVGRVSLGEVYFPLSVCAIYLLSRQDLILYIVPLLILTFADAVAALIGTRYGFATFETRGGTKSVEGSAAFFLAAFFSVHVPILLSGRADRLESLLIAVIVGLLIMMLEAISWAGLDNLFVPLMAFALVKGLLSLEAWELAMRLVITASLTALVFFGSRHTALKTDARLAAILVGHFVWMVADLRWVLMPAVLFLSFRILAPSPEYERRYAQTVYAVLSLAAAGLVWVYLARVFQRPHFFYPFTVTFAAGLAMVGIIRERFANPSRALWRIVAAQTAKGSLLILFPYMLLEWWSEGATANLALELASAVVSVLAASIVFCAAARPNAVEVHPKRWLYQALAAGLASGLSVMPFAAGWIGESLW
jgi:phytol kinase